MSNRALVDYYT